MCKALLTNLLLIAALAMLTTVSAPSSFAGVPVGSCCVANTEGAVGCNDSDCQDIVCGTDSFCCDTGWDGICAATAAEMCGDLCANVSNCCTSDGCDDIECQDSVCDIDALCCSDWDEICADLAVNNCGDLCEIVEDSCVDEDCAFLDDQCNEGICAPDNQCIAIPRPNSTPCEDGNVCTSGNGSPQSPDHCEAGVCVGVPVTCDPLTDQCNEGVCNTSGACVAIPKPSSTPCEDGNACTSETGAAATPDHCDAGACVGVPVDCSDLDNQCNDGVCNAATGACAPIAKANSTPCEDGNACTSETGEEQTPDHCSGGMCTGIPVDCSGSDDQCNGGVCDAPTGACVLIPNDDSTPCEDGSACTSETGAPGSPDHCSGGKCVGVPVDCSGLDDQCNDGICAPDGACIPIAKANSTPCEDGSVCTSETGIPGTPDHCSGGKCTGVPVDCDDENKCTEDSCETDGVPVTSNCCAANGTIGCDDPSCQDIVCGTDPFCCDTAWDGICADEAADLCGDLCVGSAAGCVNKDISADCEDGLFCTGDSCDPDLGCVKNDPCPDFDEGCVAHGTCDEDEDRCVPEFVDSRCDDNNDCSVDTCIGENDVMTVNGIPGCIHEQLPLCGDTCRSAGYYGSHAGDADDDDSENNVTGTIADACGCALICGEVLSNTALNDADSYLEALCVSPRGDDGLILARQLATLSLNCCASGYGNDCALDPFLGPLFAECNNTCVNGDPAALQACYEKVECYNTGGIPTESDCCAEGGNGTPGCDDPTCQDIVCGTDPFCCNTSWDGICAGEAAELCTELCSSGPSCEPRLEDSCHDQALCNDGLGFCYEKSPRASSSKRCKEALKRVDGTRREPIHCTVLPPDEDNCAAGVTGEGECCSDPNCVQDDDMCTADICENNVCESVDVCSDCCESNGSPGCDDPDCQELVCAADTFCCSASWDTTCANQAEQLCGDLCPVPVDTCAELDVCGGHCTTPDGLPGSCFHTYGGVCETTDGTTGACLNGGSCVCQPLIIIDTCAKQEICGGGCITPKGQKGQCVNAGGPMLAANGGSPSNCVCQPPIIIGSCVQQEICGGGCITPQGLKGQCVNGGTTTLVANGDSPSNCVCEPGIIIDDCAIRDVCGGPCTPIFGGPGQCVSTPSPNLSAGTTVDPNCSCQGGIIILCVAGPNGECGGPEGDICEAGQICQPGLDGECACLGGEN